jgi:glycogen operon protein
MSPRVRTGRPYPLGATWDGRGVNFALHASGAERVELCLFDADGGDERRVAFTHRRHHVWYGYVAGIGPGQLYGWRVHGRYDPGAGQRCNPHKLLLDPYARAIVGQPTWGPALYGYVVGDEAEDLCASTEDSAPVAPKCQVIDDAFDWGDSVAPRTPWARTVFYEVHVKGFTQTHPEVPEPLRGTYAGLASAPAIAHLKRLGVTAVELLPVHAFVDDHRLVELGLRNYWGYNTLGFFAPEARYAADQSPGGPVREFKAMVKALHEAGIEVILDVVYNHTCEGNHLGPTLSWKGIDHAAYYRLSPEDRRYCVDYTGTGNTLNMQSPVVIRMIMDSLRYWVSEMRVDGFRFDLAVTLGRGAVDFDPHGAFFSAIAQDPVLADVKMIAEPWDLGPDGYRVGGFPQGWAEWNGAYRDTARAFWCQREAGLPQLAPRLSGSADLFQHAGRAPTDSVNLVTVHDGFTLEDLVSYNVKHNEANGEDNRDGESHNRGWNCGAEGATHDVLVLAQRQRLKRNLLATLLLSQGTPLLLGGDEFGRTQRGNNNGYCQDSDISWFDWNLSDAQRTQLAFTERLLALRRELPALRRARFFDGRVDAHGIKDLMWLAPEGGELTMERWQDPGLPAMGALMSGQPVQEAEAASDDEAPAEAGDTVLLIVNAGDQALDFVLPEGNGEPWQARIDTCTADGLPARDEPLRERVSVASRSVLLLTQPRLAADAEGGGSDGGEPPPGEGG